MGLSLSLSIACISELGKNVGLLDTSSGPACLVAASAAAATAAVWPLQMTLQLELAHD